MGHSPTRKPKTVESNPDGLRSGTITSLLTPGVLASAHINKLMIIAKREEPHTSNQTRKKVS